MDGQGAYGLPLEAPNEVRSEVWFTSV